MSLRASPDTSSARLAKIPKDTWLDTWECDGLFACAEYNGQVGFVLRKYLEYE